MNQKETYTYVTTISHSITSNHFKIEKSEQPHSTVSILSTDRNYNALFTKSQQQFKQMFENLLTFFV